MRMTINYAEAADLELGSGKQGHSLNVEAESQACTEWKINQHQSRRMHHHQHHYHLYLHFSLGST